MKFVASMLSNQFLGSPKLSDLSSIPKPGQEPVSSFMLATRISEYPVVEKMHFTHPDPRHKPGREPRGLEE